MQNVDAKEHIRSFLEKAGPSNGRRTRITFLLLLTMVHDSPRYHLTVARNIENYQQSGRINLPT